MAGGHIGFHAPTYLAQLSAFEDLCFWTEGGQMHLSWKIQLSTFFFRFSGLLLYYIYLMNCFIYESSISSYVPLSLLLSLHPTPPPRISSSILPSTINQACSLQKKALSGALIFVSLWCNDARYLNWIP